MKKNRRRFCMILVGFALAASVAGCSREAKKNRHLKRADRYFAEQKYDKAEIEFLSVLRLDTNNAAAFRGLGAAYFEQGRFLRSAVFLHKAEELRPDDLATRYKLGLIYLTAQNLAEAR